MADPRVWVKCSICGKPIYYGTLYQLCSVTTCNKRRVTLRFCSVDCWDAHVADRNHRSAECVEERAPAS